MADLYAEIRRVARIPQSGARKLLGLDEFGQLGVSNYLPKYARLAAQGKLFVFDASAGTAKAPVVAPPTTSPEWAIYNGDTSECIIPLVVSLTIKSGTAGLGLGLLGAAAIGAQTAVTSAYASSTVSCADGSGRTPGAVYLTNNPTLIGGTPAWLHLEGTKLNAVASVAIGDTITFNCDGLFVARPNGGMVAFEALGPTGTTALYYPSILCAKVEMDFH